MGEVVVEEVHNKGIITDSYRQLVEAITDYAIYMLDPLGNVTSWSTGARQCMGYSSEAILGRNFAEFYCPQDRADGVPEMALRTAADTGRFETEGWRLRRNGATFWSSGVIEPIQNDDGDLIGFANVTRDLTDRRNVVADLKQTEVEFQRLVQSVTDYAIYMLDPEGCVTTWNAGAARIKGYAAEEIIGQNFACFFTSDDRSEGAPRRAIDTARRAGRFETEALRVRKDGSQFWASVVIDAIYSDTGDIIGFAKVTRDITERRAAQAALDKKQNELFQSQKMEVIGQLTGGFAHDFNNLLSVILGSLEMLEKRTSLTPEAKQLLDNAVQSGKRGALLIKDMLTFSRYEAAAVGPLDSAELVAGLANIIGRSIGPMIRLETRLPEGLPKMTGDANQVSSALLNLAINARDAMPDGGSLVISGEERWAAPGERAGLNPGRYLCLSVRDTGSGMSAEILANATKPFFTTKAIGKGTGLGLTTVASVVEQSGGKLVLRSALGAGTVVELWFPACETDEVEIAAMNPNESTSSLGQSLHILAVDDDDLVLTNTVLMLEDMGHFVLKATSGEEALDLLQSEPHIDLVLTDYAMPMMTGSELADIAWERYPALPIILATGYAKLPFGANPALPLISKPFSQVQLSDVIATRLGQASVG